MAARRLFSALRTLAAPSSRTTGFTSGGAGAGAGRALRGEEAARGGGRAGCFCRPIRYPTNAPTAAPKPNATHRPMRENYARRGVARAAPYHGGLATPITAVRRKARAPGPLLRAKSAKLGLRAPPSFSYFPPPKRRHR